jgi:hypothetical protein
MIETDGIALYQKLYFEMVVIADLPLASDVEDEEEEIAEDKQHWKFRLTKDSDSAKMNLPNPQFEEYDQGS